MVNLFCTRKVDSNYMDAWQSGRMQRIANPQRNPRRFESYCVLHFWFCSPLAVCKTVTLMRGRSSRRFNSVQNHQIESCLSGLRWHPAKVLGYASSPMGSNPILSAKCCMLTGGLVTGLSRRPSEKGDGVRYPHATPRIYFPNVGCKPMDLKRYGEVSHGARYLVDPPIDNCCFCVIKIWWR